MDHRVSKLVFVLYEIDYVILESKVPSLAMEVRMRVDVVVYDSLDSRVNAIMPNWGSIIAKMDVGVVAYLVEMGESVCLYDSAIEIMGKDFQVMTI